MKSIMTSRISTSGPEWENVSCAAKHFVRSLLQVREHVSNNKHLNGEYRLNSKQIQLKSQQIHIFGEPVKFLVKQVSINDMVSVEICDRVFRCARDMSVDMHMHAID